MNFYISLFLGIVFAFICAYVAKKKFRNPSLWFLAGLLFSIFALIILLILPIKEERIEQDPELMPNLKELQELESVEAKPNENSTENYSNKLWYYLDDSNQQCGPMTMKGIMNQLKDGKINSDTFVWNEELKDWKPLKETSDFQLFQNRKN
jgi:predicted PurR-regulated permease PerM